MFARLFNEPERLAGILAIGAWAALPLSLGPLLGAALDPTRPDFRTPVSVGLWVWWLTVLVCLGTPRPVTLSIVRIAGPAALPAAAWAAIETDDTTIMVLGVAGSVLATALLLQPALADRFVDGLSYGEERRFVLRPPGPVLIGLLVPSWAVTVAGLVAGPMLLLDEQWVVGSIASVVGLPAAFVAGRALHQLTDRFVVFVPNGLVLHDLTVLREPVLFGSGQIVGLAPARSETTASDLTNAALGLALELKLARPATVPTVTGRTGTETRDVRELLISPSRPAAVMRHAQQRGLRIV